MFGDNNQDQGTNDNKVPSGHVDAPGDSTTGVSPFNMGSSGSGADSSLGQPAEPSSAPPAADTAPEEPAEEAPKVDSADGRQAEDTPPGNNSDDELLEIKKQALSQLTPLVSHLDQTPEEKFRTLMMMIQASDSQGLIKQAHEVAQQISDDKTKAQALLDIVNEINYFTQATED